jgi:hypothetical protein
MAGMSALMKPSEFLVVPFGAQFVLGWPKESPCLGQIISAKPSEVLPMFEAIVKWFHGFLL